jgi:WD40 repeat protein
VLSTSTFNQINLIVAHEGGVGSLVFDPLNDKTLYSGGKDALLKKWDLTTEKCLISIPSHNFILYDLKIMEDKLLSVSRDKTIKCWDLSVLKVEKRIDFKMKGHKHSVNALILISTSLFVSCSDDRQIICWEITS